MIGIIRWDAKIGAMDFQLRRVVKFWKSKLHVEEFAKTTDSIMCFQTKTYAATANSATFISLIGSKEMDGNSRAKNLLETKVFMNGKIQMVISFL